MKEAIKKALLIGLGAVTIAKPKVKKAVSSFQKKGLITKKEAEDLVSEVIAIARKKQQELILLSSKGASGMKKRLSKDAKRYEKKGRKEAKRILSKMQKAMD